MPGVYACFQGAANTMLRVTITPACVLVIGGGVAGLQALATARRPFMKLRDSIVVCVKQSALAVGFDPGGERLHKF